MRNLEDKIFSVLVEDITVEEFEEWLYQSDEFLSQLESNSFYFDIVAINYKNNKFTHTLENLIKDKFNEAFFETYNIKRSCFKIIKSENPEEIYQIISNLLIDFDYDTEFDILWKFYWLKADFELFEGSMNNKFELQEKAKFYSEQVLISTKYCNGFEATKIKLKAELMAFKKERKVLNRSLKNKILAFFKKY